MNDKRTIRLLDKVSGCLNDGEWEKAKEYCEALLESDNENAEAYLGKLMAECEIKSRDELKNSNKPLEDCEYYEKIISYGDEELVELVKDANGSVKKTLEEKRKKKAVAKKAAMAAVAVILVAVILVVFVIPAVKKNNRYKEAVAFMQGGESQSAMCVFKELGDYKDSAQLLVQLRKDFAPKSTIGSGKEYVMALNNSGKVLSVYSDDKSYTDSWSNIVAVSSGAYHSVGLKADGTVISTEIYGDMVDYGQCDVSGWTDIISVSVGKYHTVGLKADGTVVAVGYNGDGRCDVTGWADIIAVSAGGSHTVGLKADGTVVAVGDYTYNQIDVKEWKGIVAVSAGGRHTAGLKADGTVVVTSSADDNIENQKAAEIWTDIVAISAGHGFTVGLKADGTAVATGSNSAHEIKVDAWKDVVAISAGSEFALGLTKNGTLVSTAGYKYYSQFSDWKDIKLPDVTE